MGQSHCAPVFAGDCKALRKEPQRCDESHPQMEPAWGKIAQGKFSLGSYRDPNNQLRPCDELTKTECLYIATKFKAHSGSPVIQEIILSNRIGAISVELAKRLNVDPVQALQLFYESKTCEDLRDKSSGLLPK